MLMYSKQTFNYDLNKKVTAVDKTNGILLENATIYEVLDYCFDDGKIAEQIKYQDGTYGFVGYNGSHRVFVQILGDLV